MQLADIFNSIRRHWWLSASLFLVALVVLAGFLITREEIRGDDVYRASVQILVPSLDEDGVRPEGVPPALLQGQQSLALSESTRQAALANIPEEARADVALGFATSETGDIITLSATSRDVEVSRATSESFASAFIQARRESVATRSSGSQGSIRRSLDILSERLDEVESSLEEDDVPLPPVVPTGGEGDGPPLLLLPADAPLDTILLAYERNDLINRIRSFQAEYADVGAEALTPRSYAEIVERPAPVQITPPSPSPLVPAAVVLGVGLLLALAVPVVIDRLDRTIEDPSSAAAALGAPVLTSVSGGSRGDRRKLSAPGSSQDTAYRALATTSLTTDRLPGAILVSSPTGEAQDLVAANFAASLARLGVRVALVATSARQSWFSTATGADDQEPGSTLAELLHLAHTGQLQGDIAPLLAHADIDGLLVVPADHDREDVLFDGLPSLLKALAESSIDITVIAGPALLEDPDATIFAWATRSVLWAVEAGAVDEVKCREAASRLALAGVTPFGVAFVDEGA